MDIEETIAQLETALEHLYKVAQYGYERSDSAQSVEKAVEFYAFEESIDEARLSLLRLLQDAREGRSAAPDIRTTVSGEPEGEWVPWELEELNEAGEVVSKKSIKVLYLED